MLAHRCQLKPALAHTLAIDPTAVPDVYGTDEYILARDLTRGDSLASVEETDLFARVD
jgi:hypothetical protein